MVGYLLFDFKIFRFNHVITNTYNYLNDMLFNSGRQVPIIFLDTFILFLLIHGNRFFLKSFRQKKKEDNFILMTLRLVFE